MNERLGSEVAADKWDFCASDYRRVTPILPALASNEASDKGVNYSGHATITVEYAAAF